MATMNPLEKKAKTSFIKGIVVATLICAIIIGILAYFLFDMKGKEKLRIEAQKSVLILTQDVKSGEEITIDLLSTTLANQEVATAGAMTMGAFTDMSTILDEGGNPIAVKVVAKIDIPAKSILTSEMVVTEENIVTNDLREQEYNMIVLPSMLETGDTIDIRLRLPSGIDYLVLSKKKVTLPMLGTGVPSNTILINVTEDQILTMSAAIVDAYQITGSKLYATKFTDPGLQSVATATYVPSSDTLNMIQNDANIVTSARNALINRYNSTFNTYRPGVNNALQAIDQSIRDSNLQGQTSAEITTQQTERKQYIDSIYGAQ